MADFKDAGHRPHAAHTGEVPHNPIVYGPESIRVTLDTWGPQQNLFPALYDALQSNWGDAPSRIIDRGVRWDQTHMHGAMTQLESKTGWDRLSPEEQQYVEQCFRGQTLQQALERITFSFTIDGVSRACTHQLVRTRLGAAFMQHGGRDNDWRHRAWTMPETIRRACRDHQYFRGDERDRERNCITSWHPIDDLIADWTHEQGPIGNGGLEDAITHYLARGRALYAALVDGGVPWQDARRLLWMGTQTYIHADYNWPALKGVIGKRSEPVMDWEINCVAQLMQREVNIHCPPIFGQYLRSGSVATGRDVMAGLESWTPTGRFPNPHELCECGHTQFEHGWDEPGDKACAQVIPINGSLDKAICPCLEYRPVDPLSRTHRPEQNPFFILSPSAIAGGPIEWIPTNGTWPKDL